MRAFVIALALLAAQQAAPKPAFEVATIKRNVSLSEGGSIGMEPGGRFRGDNGALGHRRESDGRSGGPAGAGAVPEDVADGAVAPRGSIQAAAPSRHTAAADLRARRRAARRGDGAAIPPDDNRLPE